MKKIKLLILCFTLGLAARAQNQTPASTENYSCGFNAIFERANVNYLQLLEAYKKENANKRSIPQGVVFKVPVVFHLVYAANQPQFNLHDSILEDQIDVLNKAFRKQHADTANTREIFKPLSIDAEIEFYLATIDPEGNPTTGITRTVSSRRYFGNTPNSLDSTERIKKTIAGGIDPWPTKNYLNIWVGNLSDSTGKLAVLGYAVPPINPLPQNWPAGFDLAFALLTDGIALQVHAVGSNNALSSATNGIYAKGRCAVHEVGHYLGLQHIFGSTNGKSANACGNKLLSDGMNDTPEQALISQLKECPDPAKNSCGEGVAGDLPDMWENYMDYTKDACQTLFTKDQIALMRSVLDNQRSTLMQIPTSIQENNTTTVMLYPNPASNLVHVPNTGKINKVQVINYMGQTLLEFTGAAAATHSYNIESLPNGNYLFLLEHENGSMMTAKCHVLR